ncbi:hypothetical protein PG987_006628 [Apiospora arundinis]
MLDGDGSTPLHIAVKHGRLQTAKALVVLGADHRIRDKQNRSAKDYAADLSERDAAFFLDIIQYWGKSKGQRAVRTSFREIAARGD